MDLAVSLTEAAPAKVNLALHVTGRRAEGYHTIESLVVFTRFGDRIEVAPAEADQFSVSGRYAEAVPIDSANLVVRARDALRRVQLVSRPVTPPSVLPDISPTRGEIGSSARFASSAMLEIGEGRDASPISPLEGEMSGRTEGGATRRDLGLQVLPPVSITLEKNLPVASGVGGGSSDAAAVLRALARHWSLALGEAELARIGLALGADVPMCLTSRPLIARGIGDEVTTLPDFPTLGLVLVNPGVAVSTAEVFAALSSSDNPGLPALPRSIDFHSLRGWLESTRNDLEAPAKAIQPVIGKALAALNKAGAGFARMSGSGATCFGLFETGNVAKRAAAEIRSRNPGWFVAATRSMASEGYGSD